MKSHGVDKPLLASVLVLALSGYFIFSSASLGQLARDGNFGSIAINQFIGLLIGIIAMLIIAYKVDYKVFRRHAFYIFAFSIVLNLLLYVPGLAFKHGGAVRWVDLKFFTFQPSEFLKIAFIIYFAAWLSGVKDKVREAKYGLIPFIIIVGVIGALLLKQSDTDTLAVMIATGISMLVAAGARIRHILIMALVTILCIGLVAFTRPYARARIMTFLNPAADPLGSGYQIQQSLIAIGSGGVLGRGYGQSIQKFNYLPEPIGDSIFAVLGEEFGFLGTVCLVALFVFFAARSLKIAGKVNDQFGALLIVGVVTLILVESFMNISSMLGIIPLTGQPLLFVSHGGTALMIVLAEVGIMLNISRHIKSQR